MKQKTDIVDLNDWLTIEEAVSILVSSGNSRTGARLYKLAQDGQIKSRLIKTKLCLNRDSFNIYHEQIAKRKSKNKRRT